MKKRNLLVIGGGQMGRALTGGMLESGFLASDQISVVDPSEASREWWQENHKSISTLQSVSTDALDVDVVLLAVKPNLVVQVAAEIRAQSNSPALIISIAAGVDLDSICDAVGHDRVVRVMPNTPSLVGAGASAYCIAAGVDRDDIEWIERSLCGVGLTVRVDEKQIDAVTGLSGSGPAYICLVIEALADGGVLAGLPRDLAMQLATQTVLGTAKMVMQTGRHPGELKDAVASPGGTTIAALKVLEDQGLRSALIGAVKASADRSREL